MSKICLFSVKRPALRDYLLTANTWKIDFPTKKYKGKCSALQTRLYLCADSAPTRGL